MFFNLFDFVLFQNAYSYAIAAFNGHRNYMAMKNVFTSQDVCSLIACVEMDSKQSCGKRIPRSKSYDRYTFKELVLKTELPVDFMKIMPDTLTTELISLASSEFEQNM